MPANRDAADYRRSDSRFSPAGLASLQHFLKPLWETADRHNAPPAAIALAWALSKGPHVHVIPGAKSVGQLAIARHAAEIVLSEDDREKLEMIPVRGPTVSC